MRAEARYPTVTVVSLSRSMWGAETSLLTLAAHSPVPLRIVAPEGELLTAARDAGHDTRRLTSSPGSALMRLSRFGEDHGVASFPALTTAATLSLARDSDLWRDGPVVGFSQWLHQPLALAGRMRHRPVVLDLHDGPFTRAGGWAQAAAARSASRVVAVSRTALRHAHAERLRRARIVPRPVVLPPGVTARDPATSSGDHPARVVVLGRLDPEKRVDVAVDAVIRLARTRPVRLDLVGSAHRSDGLPASAVEHPDVEVHGRLPHVEALKVVARADLLLSLAPGEAFGRSVVEAALLGVPSLVSPHAGVADLMTDGVTGFLESAPTVGTVLDQLDSLLADRERLTDVGAAARVALGERCAPDRVARDWLAAVLGTAP